MQAPCRGNGGSIFRPDVAWPSVGADPVMRKADAQQKKARPAGRALLRSGRGYCLMTAAIALATVSMLRLFKAATQMRPLDTA